MRLVRLFEENGEIRWIHQVAFGCLDVICLILAAPGFKENEMK